MFSEFILDPTKEPNNATLKDWDDYKFNFKTGGTYEIFIGPLWDVDKPTFSWIEIEKIFYGILYSFFGIFILMVICCLCCCLLVCVLIIGAFLGCIFKMIKKNKDYVNINGSNGPNEVTPIVNSKNYYGLDQK
jgi:hypothetical protein